MADPTASAVAMVTAGFAAAGLGGPTFDVDATAADLADRLGVDAGLDLLIGPGDPGEPTPFDPADPR